MVCSVGTPLTRRECGDRDFEPLSAQTMRRGKSGFLSGYARRVGASLLCHTSNYEVVHLDNQELLLAFTTFTFTFAFGGKRKHIVE
jgi:hypothetical protein